MENEILLGLWHCILPIPPWVWQRVMKPGGEPDFMGRDHHRVRNLVVRELPRQAIPLTPEWISRQLDLPIPAVVAILDELEHNLTFLFRNPQGAVTWAYPVTVDRTPHQVSFSTGEQIYAA
ncbi:MAG: hypothetical protein JXB85_09180 [Anaerolineales bacterium]|nr:hypothetical protein [Anaerolineales bacterium]